MSKVLKLPKFFQVLAALNLEFKRAKENHYKDLMNDNKGNSSTLWKIIGELADLKSNSHRQMIHKRSDR